jgi:hypothetical protein
VSDPFDGNRVVGSHVGRSVAGGTETVTARRRNAATLPTLWKTDGRNHLLAKLAECPLQTFGCFL